MLACQPVCSLRGWSTWNGELYKGYFPGKNRLWGRWQLGVKRKEKLTTRCNSSDCVLQGVIEMKETTKDNYTLENHIQYFLDRFYMSRISIRMLINQHSMWTTILNSMLADMSVVGDQISWTRAQVKNEYLGCAMLNRRFFWFFFFSCHCKDILLRSSLWWFPSSRLCVGLHRSFVIISAILFGDQQTHPRHIGCIDPYTDILHVAEGKAHCYSLADKRVQVERPNYHKTERSRVIAMSLKASCEPHANMFISCFVQFGYLLHWAQIW